MLPNGQTPHILVVNHAPEILDLMRELLGEAGYRVSTLTRPDQDIDSIVAIAPELIIIDYMWSSSDNEWTLLNLLTIDRRTRDIPVIVCTAAVHHVYEVSGHLQKIGVRVVFKPFNIDHLLGVVANALNGKALDKDGALPGPE
jgi:CheY-like chemotaxis protein